MTEKDLNKILTDLRVSKKSGELDNYEKFVNQQDKWRNTIDYSVLETCVKHYNEGVRLDALALLVESKKSTLKFTNAELDIIFLFLMYNLEEKFEYVSLVMKALKRIKDSLNVMKKKLMQQSKTKLSDSSEKIDDDKASYKVVHEIEVYNAFFLNLRDLCVNNLYPDATYSRRKNSLQILCIMLEFLDHEFRDITWNSKQTEKIFMCLLLDKYETNKKMAFRILKSINPIILGLDAENRLCEIINVATDLGNSIRPIDSITAAYMFKICMLSPLLQNVLCEYYNMNQFPNGIAESHILQLILFLIKRLEISLMAAKENIVMAVTKYSLYGYLFCLRSLLSDCDLSIVGTEKLWQETISKLISMCFELNKVVSVIVNNSSPEGHLPMDLSPHTTNGLFFNPEKEIITPQMILLCSWRTVKEVSLLFGQLAIKSTISNHNVSGELLTENQIIQIGEHLVTLLSETKHRGAFEQAYVGFNQLCTRLWRIENTTLNQLPKLWLHQILLAITGLLPGNFKFCATRRSAGVPFMVQALVSTEPSIQYNANISALHSVMKILLGFTELEDNVNVWKDIKRVVYEKTIFSEFENFIDLSRTDINESLCEDNKIQVTEIKIHALNILRALFRHSPLGDSVKIFIADGVIAAFKNYDGKSWAERNAATLLFSALIIRIFGVQRTKDHINLTTDNKMTGKIFFEKYPSLLPFMLDELQTFVSINESLIKPNIQSILLLLSRLYLNYNSDGDDINWKIDEFIHLVSQCAKSPVCKTRELAARALVPLMTETSATNIIKKLFEVVASGQVNHLSLNAIHGYMLQILEIVKRLRVIKQKLTSTDLCSFFEGTIWILRNLEIDSNGPVCFPLATAYLDMIHELLKADYKMITNTILLNISSTLKRHVLEHNILKQAPSQEIYKVSAVKLIVYIGQNYMFNITARIHLHILNVPEPELQTIAWSTIIEVIKGATCPHEKRLLNDRAIDVACNSISYLPKYNPELQDAIFDFLYASLMFMDKSLATEDHYDKQEICNLVLSKMRINNQRHSYCKRNSYLRLLGKSYSTLRCELKDDTISIECTEDVYSNFCDNSWIGTLEEDFRRSVFEIMYQLYYTHTDVSRQYSPLLEWWTTVLQLLVDDNLEVRKEASRLVCKIESNGALECVSAMVQTFFEQFYNIVGTKYPSVAVVALFCWGISLSGNMDYEMDETDVFNKCKNYDCFEPVQLSNTCVQFIKAITKRYSLDSPLPVDAMRWLTFHLNLDLTKATSFRKLVSSYGDYVPVIEKQLRDILDPTYKDKLLQILAYEKYASLHSQEC
ncbi:thyroid adenoma-associated protein [Vespula pensylvanica]|uniref:thyroid adenoma-associated protein n=1 Tax=Vespula pensylvanica TaxID=30213 RepID=UPI001CBA34BE|nr:thyroid adenoma-associated protein [Vespula pensylvanica]